VRSIFFVPPNAFLLARANRDLWSPFGNAQIIKAIQENNIKKVYAVDVYSSNYFFVQKRCVLVYGEEMTLLKSKRERKRRIIKESRRKYIHFGIKRKTMTNRGTRTICFGKIDYPRVICHLMPLGNDNKEVNSTAQYVL